MGAEAGSVGWLVKGVLNLHLHPVLVLVLFVVLQYIGTGVKKWWFSGHTDWAGDGRYHMM